MCLLFQAAGHTTAWAADGARALAYLRANPAPRLVLLDLMMPDFDGWQFLADRHKDPALAAVPVVVLTAAGGIDAGAVQPLGADDVIHKPVDPEQLLAAAGRYC
jgi:CheY-like chemotaxis protein